MSFVPQPYKYAWTATCAAVVATAVTIPPSASPAVSQIERYCRTSWRNAGIAREAWEDCTQETFVELLRRVSVEGLEPAIEERDSAERRELNRSIWCVIQRWRRQPRSQSLPRADHGSTTDRRDVSGDWPSMSELLAESSVRLSPRQRDILILSAAGHTVPEIAAALKLRVEQVSDTKYKAIQRLRRGNTQGTAS